MSGHKADCTIETNLDDMLKPKTAFGEDCAMPTMRILHGANMYCSSALVSCLVTFGETLVEVDVMKDVCVTGVRTGGGTPSLGVPAARSRYNLRCACRYVVRRFK